MSVNKKAYFQGGGGVNEPTPGQKKYKSDPALVVQPRFKEPFYRNYDLYNTPGEHSPGAGWHDMEKYKSISEFLEAKRKKLEGKYVADDSWQQDNGERTKQNPNMKARAAIFERIIKTARMPGMGLFHSLHRKFGPGGTHECKDSDIEYTDRRDAFICGKCLHMGENSGGPTPTSKELHASKNHNPDRIDYRNNAKTAGPNYDLGKGLYQEMSDGKVDSVEEFREEGNHGPGALMNITKKKNNKYDIQHIDFPIDDQIDESLGGPMGEETDNPVGEANLTGGYLDEYLPENDFEGKSPTELDFGRDYDDSDVMKKLINKYLGPSQSELFGLPDGIEPDSDLDAEQTMDVEEPFTGTSDIGTDMYEDKWNV